MPGYSRASPSLAWLQLVAHPVGFAGEEDHKEMREKVIRLLFSIYRFYTDTGMDLDDDIPGLLVGNTTPQERRIIAG